MKHLICAALILSALTCSPTNPSAFGADPTFEEIEILKTSLQPIGSMVNRGDGYFYGAARWASNMTYGCIFRIAPHQEAEVIHTFASISHLPAANVGGAFPSCAVVLGPDGSLYGGTSGGGANGFGVIYKIAADGTYSVLHDLLPLEGIYPQGLVITPEGDLYGIANGGGTNETGTMFHIGRNGVFEVVYTFATDVVTDFSVPAPPASPQTLTLGADGNLYGTAAEGGPIHPSGAYHAAYGVFFRYDGPDAITVLSDFDLAQKRPLFAAAASDGIYVTTEDQLMHFALDGTPSVLADFTPELNGVEDIDPGSLLVMPDGVYGVGFYGGTYQSGFVFRYVADSGYSILYNFPTVYAYRQRVVVAGNDNLVYGLAAYPEGYTPPRTNALKASALTMMNTALVAATTAQTNPANATKPRTFRFRNQSTQTANFVPVAKPDVAWLPTYLSAKKDRMVNIDVLANDHDPDKNPLTLTGVVPPDTGYAQLISVAGKLKVQFVTNEFDPASRHLTYHISDGKGGTASGDVTVYSLATGTYSATASDSSTPPAAPGVLTITVGEKNATTVSFIQNKHRYAGKGVIGADDSANFLLKYGIQPPLNLHLDVQRGSARQLAVTIQGGGSVFSAVCPKTGK